MSFFFLFRQEPNGGVGENELHACDSKGKGSRIVTMKKVKRMALALGNWFMWGCWPFSLGF